MHIGPKTSLPHSSSPSPIQGAETNPTSSPSKLHLAGQFLSRSVKSLGNTLKSSFVSTYQWAKKTGSKLLGESRPLSPEEQADKVKDLDKSLKDCFPGGEGLFPAPTHRKILDLDLL